MPTQKTPPRVPENEPTGPIVGTIIIIILLIIGGFYFWNTRLNQRASQEPLPLITGNASATINP